MVGRLAAAKLGSEREAMTIGQSIEFEGKTVDDQRTIFRRWCGLRIRNLVQL